MCSLPNESAGTDGVTINHQLAIGSWVWGIFVDGSDAQQPLVAGVIAGMNGDAPDLSALTRGVDNTIRYDGGLIAIPGSPYGAKYPYNLVRQTRAGHVKEYDSTPGAERTRELHPSGTQYEVHPNGDRVEITVGSNYKLVLSDDRIEVRGNVQVFVVGDAEINVGGNADIVVGGSTQLDTVSLTVNAPVTMINGLLQVSGELVTSSSITSGGLIQSGGDVVTSAGKSLDTHQHPYTWTDGPGSSLSSPPV
jgi:phage baseplate assembly protein gpV